MSDPKERILSPERARLLLYAILILSMAARFYHLNAPIADSHSWNQISAATTIRNFEKYGIDFFHPRWDLLEKGHPGPRIEAEEAPIYHTLVALGATETNFVRRARFISIIFGTLAGLFLFRLMRRKSDDTAALIATFFFLFGPFPFFFFRAVMSDAAMMFGIVASLFYFDRYLETPTWRDALLAGAMLSLAGLFKPFALHAAFPMAILTFAKMRWAAFRRPELYVFAVIALVPPLAWVGWAMHVGTLGNVTNETGTGGLTKMFGELSLLWSPRWYNILQARVFDQMLTPVVTAMAFAALVIRSSRKQSGFFLVWFIGVALYFAIVRMANQEHNYYQLPATAPMAALGGIGLSAILHKLHGTKREAAAGFVLLLFAVVSMLYVRPRFALEMSSHIAGKMVAAETSSSEKIVVVDPGATRKNQVLFAADREGWHFQHLKPEDIQRYKDLGAKAVVLVLEDSQQARAADTKEALSEQATLVKRTEGAYGKDGRNHEITIYRLD